MSAAEVPVGRRKVGIGGDGVLVGSGGIRKLAAHSLGSAKLGPGDGAGVVTLHGRLERALRLLEMAGLAVKNAQAACVGVGATP